MAGNILSAFGGGQTPPQQQSGGNILNSYRNAPPEQKEQKPSTGEPKLPFMAEAVDKYGSPYYGEGFKGFARKVFAKIFDPSKLLSKPTEEQAKLMEQGMEKSDEILDRAGWDEWLEEWTGITGKDVTQSALALNLAVRGTDEEGKINKDAQFKSAISTVAGVTYRGGGQVVPLARFIDLTEHLDLLSGAITFTRARARELVTELISRQCCGNGGCGCSTDGLVQLGQPNGKPASSESAAVIPELGPVADEFFRRILAQDVSPADVFRITTTSFMDAYNFDVRQAMKDCVHFILPSGHIIPFSAYNLLYREGLVPLPRIANVRDHGDTERKENTMQRIGIA